MDYKYAFFIGGGFLLFIFLTVLFFNKSRENYVLGALGPYREVYYKCMSHCEREDLSKKLGATHGSLMCDAFCNSMGTEMARQGDASRSTQPYYKPPIIRTSIDKCYEKCGYDSNPDANECRDKCFCHSEVIDKCKQECAYSDMPKDQCIDQCSKIYGANCSTLAWNFK
jgi:hypothetical protein